MKKHLYITIFILISFLFSCSPAKYVGENESLLVKVKITSKNKNIDKNDIKKYNKQKKLRKTMGYAFYARLYNIPNPKKDKKRNKKDSLKLEKKNKRREAKFDNKTGKFIEKENLYKSKINKNKRLGNFEDTLKYYNKQQTYAQKIKNRKNIRTQKLEDNKKKKVFTWYGWLRNVGDKPPIYDSILAKKSAEQMVLYLRNKGYYNAEVNFKIKQKRRKKVVLIYSVETQKPTIIAEIEYDIKDKEIARLINKKGNDLKIETGSLLDVDLLQKNRTNISEYLKNEGYYYFSKDYIKYSIDTIGNRENAKLTLSLKQFTDSKGRRVNHNKYTINNIYIFSDYNPNEALRFPRKYFLDIDTIQPLADSTLFFTKKKHMIIKPKVIANELYIYNDSIYNFSKVKDTYNHLSKFRIYKLTNIQFEEVDTLKNLLNCNIQLSPSYNQGYVYEIVGTNSSGNIGAATNFKYFHKNIFRGGEILDMKLKVALESQNLFTKSSDSTDNFGFNTQEYGLEMKITFPRLLTPFKYERFIRKNNPRTVLAIAFIYQDRPEYKKLAGNTNIDYYWKSNKYTSHVFTPIKFSSIRVSGMSDKFREYITKSYLQESYEDHFVNGTGYNLVYSNQEKNIFSYIYIKFNATIAGNSLIGLMATTGQKKVDSNYVMPYLGTLIAQFVKSDIDFRYYFDFTEGQKIAGRIFAGAGLPYGNMKLLPFGEKYFSGGANGIRAWQVRSLGPGSYVMPENISLPNQSADIKLEANFEYRLKLFSIVESAFFIDAGNIWAINKYDNRKGALFKFDEFYKQIAVGTGFGIRLDISFFIIRLDLGIKVRNPSALENMRFIPGNRSYYPQDFTYNFAIGYPF